CLGFDIMNNFNAPYMASNPSDFWQRWHISLSTWLKDYLYIPLGGNRHGQWNTLRNLMLTMVIGGLWHGAAWTFIIWGFYHGALLVVYRMAAPWGKNFLGRHDVLRSFVNFGKIILFFHVVCLGWLIFRAQSLEQLGQLMQTLCFGPFALAGALTRDIVQKLAFFAGPALVVQMAQYFRGDILVMYKLPWFFRGIWYYALIMLSLIYGVTDANDFIYFQF
ncbi:MAG: MBOAT family protein, partial [Candidatus Omnitrophica bacterium]|nr:MBOAT family protein [Candidatus Omnitrophota bacterium]